MGCIASQLGASLRRQFHASEDLVVLSSLHETDGSPALLAGNKLVLLLLGIDREPALRHIWRSDGAGGAHVLGPGPLHISMQVMLVANFGGSAYAEGLKLLSKAMAYLHARPILTRANTPELDGQLDRLTIELFSPSTADLAAWWGMLQAPLRPAACYSVRVLTLDDARITGRISSVTRTDTQLHAPVNWRPA